MSLLEFEYEEVLINNKLHFQCVYCKCTFHRFNLFTLHIQSKNSKFEYSCDLCCETKSRESNLKIHKEKFHSNMSGKSSKKSLSSGSPNVPRTRSSSQKRPFDQHEEKPEGLPKKKKDNWLGMRVKFTSSSSSETTKGNSQCIEEDVNVCSSEEEEDFPTDPTELEDNLGTEEMNNSDIIEDTGEEEEPEENLGTEEMNNSDIIEDTGAEEEPEENDDMGQKNNSDIIEDTGAEEDPEESPGTEQKNNSVPNEPSGEEEEPEENDDKGQKNNSVPNEPSGKEEEPEENDDKGQKNNSVPNEPSGKEDSDEHSSEDTSVTNRQWLLRFWSFVPLDNDVYSNCSELELLAIEILKATSSDYEKLISTLSIELQESFGTFVASLLIVSAINHVKVETLVSNYSQMVKIKFNSDLKSILYESVLGKCRANKSDLYDSKIDIPDEMKKEIFLCKNVQSKAIGDDVTCKIMQSIYDDFEQSKFIDTSVNVKTRVGMYCKIYQAWCNNTFTINSKFISQICVESRHFDLGTDTKIILKDSISKFSINKDAIFEALNVKLQDDSLTSEISQQEANLIADLLYYKKRIPKGCYSFEILKFLLSLGCSEKRVYTFMFGDNEEIKDSFGIFNRRELMYYKIKLRKIIPKSKCTEIDLTVMTKLDEKDVNYMFGENGMEIDHVDLYKVLVMWSANMVSNFESIRANPSSKEKFEKVKGLIKDYANLKDIYDIVWYQGFLDLRANNVKE